MGVQGCPRVTCTDLYVQLFPSPKLLSGKMDHAWRAYREGTVGEMQGLWDIITLCDTPKLLRDYAKQALVPIVRRAPVFPHNSCHAQRLTHRAEVWAVAGKKDRRVHLSHFQEANALSLTLRTTRETQGLLQETTHAHLQTLRHGTIDVRSNDTTLGRLRLLATSAAALSGTLPRTPRHPCWNVWLRERCYTRDGRGARRAGAAPTRAWD